ncbi:MAG TPA: tRNA dihydrouridine synthase DusB [Candidatus Hydrogenedens sp.]|nr:tRNA dihydrouridine synthase DusB [Candidatus Hydrogenedens sp.]HOL19874.1 tRNA dihydrouridine synthase DusB [Candidatus Hydrogenedens sp.]HPP59797.1 tRNA dihydrouridine synthase DusB [Candidatus Hydrogenedens sp.]
MKIGKYEIEKPLFLAPMDDITDYPFRNICKEWGADVVITEFVSAEAVIRNVDRSLKKMNFSEQERPIGIQLYGNAESSMANATRTAESFNPDFIDINAGCWVKKIVNRGDGAGLLKDLKKLKRVLSEVKSNTGLPVTLKTRLGWDDSNINIFDVLEIAYTIGIDFITVHLRTRQQGLKGDVDWSWIPKIKERTRIPFVANGDIKTPQDVEKCFELGADGVMIGRAAIGNPFLFKRCKLYLKKGEYLPEPNIKERIQWCLIHFRKHIEYYGEQRGVPIFRKFYNGYLHGYPYIGKIRTEIMNLKDAQKIEDVLISVMENPEKASGMVLSDTNE